MKKQTTISGYHLTIIVIVLFFGMIPRGLSQPIELNFKCLDAEDSTVITPDSIVVTNTSLKLDTVLVNGATTLTLCNEIYTGQKEIQLDNEASMEVYPNPAGERTKILLSTDQKEMITLSMYDAAGKLIQSWSRYLDKGLHTLEAGFPEDGIYMFHAAPRNFSAKVMVTGANNSSKGFIRYKKASTDKPKEARLKSASAMKDTTSSGTCFPFEPGDKLKIEGYKQGYNKVIKYKSPDSSQTDTLRFYNPNFCPSTVTDYDGNTYEVVKIGDQCWMAENLKVTHYSDGTPIPHVTDSAAWSNLTETDKAWCYYDNASTNADNFGALYTWTAAMNGAAKSKSNPSGVQGVCPAGWHLPSDDEWEQLAEYISNDNGGYPKDGDDWNHVGGHLKATSGWHSEGNGTDDYGFSGLPGGYRYFNGAFYNVGEFGNWWSTTQHDFATYGWYRSLNYSNENFDRLGDSKKNGYSVRCLLY